MKVRKLTKSEILENAGSISMDMDTYKKNKATLGKDDNVKIVPKNTNSNTSVTGLGETVGPDMISTDELYSLAKKAGSVVSDAENSLLNLYMHYSDKDMAPLSSVIKILNHYDLDIEELQQMEQPPFRPSQEFAHLFNNDSISEDENEIAGRGIEYGYHPELDNDSWDEFMKTVETVPHEKRVDKNGNIFEVRLKRKDYKLLKENKNGFKKNQKK